LHLDYRLNRLTDEKKKRVGHWGLMDR